MNFHWTGWFWVIVGTLLVGIGGWIATYGWDIWRVKPKKKNFFRKGSWDIVRGSMLVALGGLLATYGWNVISLGEQRKNLLRAASQEWVFNEARIQSPPLKGKVYYVKDDSKHVLALFPSVNTIALNGIMSSGLWNFDDPNEREFLMAISRYERALTTANRMFDRYNNHLFSIDDVNKGIAQSEQYQKSINRAEWFVNLQNSHRNVDQLLNVKYRPVLKDEEPKTGNEKSQNEE